MASGDPCHSNFMLSNLIAGTSGKQYEILDFVQPNYPNSLHAIDTCSIKHVAIFAYRELSVHVRPEACCASPAVNALAGGTEPSEDFESLQTVSEKEAQLQRDPHMVVGYLDVTAANPTAGKVLQHCKRKLDLFRKSLGGAVCVFKIGYCSDPCKRFMSYKQANFSSMMLLHVTPCKGIAQMLEAALIDASLKIQGCRNEKPGGEGPGHVQVSHFYVYVVGARADLPKPIGG